MPAEVKGVEHFDDAILVRILPQNALEQLSLHAGIICLLLFILTELNGQGPPTVFHVDTLDDLAKGARVYNLIDKVAIGDLLANPGNVESILLRYLANAGHSDTANRVDEVVRRHFGPLILGQLALILLERLLRCQALQDLRTSLHVVARHVGARIRLVIGGH